MCGSCGGEQGKRVAAGLLIGAAMARVQGWTADASASIPFVHAAIIGRCAWAWGAKSAARGSASGSGSCSGSVTLLGLG